MSQGLRVGSTFDNVYIGLTSDDAINIHGFWSQITSVTGTFIKANFAPVGIQAGDPVEFYDGAGNLVATGKVKTTPTPSYNYNGFLNGSIELAPVLGLSDVIVDIVETGKTLKENGLRVYEDILPISARLIANKSAFNFKGNEITKITNAVEGILKNDKNI